MGYSKFIQELAKGMEGKILAYSSTGNKNGCLIYLKNVNHRIFVPADAIDHQREKVIHALRRKINEGVEGTALLVLKDEGDQLIFEEDLNNAKMASQ